MSFQYSRQIKTVINVFGGVGYTILIFSYVIIFAAAFYWLASSNGLAWLGFPAERLTQTTQATPINPKPEDSGLLTTILAGVMTLVVIFVLVALPYWVGKIGSYITKKTIRLFNQSVNLKTLLIAKTTACGISIIPGPMVNFAAVGVEVAIFQLILTSIAMLVFLTQHYLAKISSGVEAKDVW
ncbi:hypothetical protein CR969_03415 [Candidatus Saccharibacteria bacterium]|nr:MAG: hypothetical protein CR969_03415 [Candidatus Saccharibacteria bacterium]